MKHVPGQDETAVLGVSAEGRLSEPPSHAKPVPKHRRTAAGSRAIAVMPIALHSPRQPNAQMSSRCDAATDRHTRMQSRRAPPTWRCVTGGCSALTSLGCAGSSGRKRTGLHPVRVLSTLRPHRAHTSWLSSALSPDDSITADLATEGMPDVSLPVDVRPGFLHRQTRCSSVRERTFAARGDAKLPDVPPPR